MQSCWLLPIFWINRLPPSLGSTSTLKICPHIGSTPKTTLSHKPEQQNPKNCHDENVITQECYFQKMLMTNMVITMTGIFDAINRPKMKLITFWRLDLSPFLVKERERENLLI